MSKVSKVSKVSDATDVVKTMTQCDATLKKTSGRCPCPGIHASTNGKHYCGRHRHMGFYTQRVIEPSSPRVVDVRAPTIVDAPSVRNGEHGGRDECARQKLYTIVDIIKTVYVRFKYMLALLTIALIMHATLKSYYHTHCDGNLIKVWMYKNNPPCKQLGSILDTFEIWSSDNFNVISRFVYQQMRMF